MKDRIRIHGLKKWKDTLVRARAGSDTQKTRRNPAGASLLSGVAGGALACRNLAPDISLAFS